MCIFRSSTRRPPPGPSILSRTLDRPPFRQHLRSPLITAASVLAVSCLALAPAWASLASAVKVVMLKGRHYEPVDLFLRRGDAITLVNGEDSAVHHAFIEADQFSFDAGDQQPGSHATLKLAQSGDFVLQCGIHPKMKLTVHVQ